MDREAWRAAILGVAKSRTRLSDFTFTHFMAIGGFYIHHLLLECHVITAILKVKTLRPREMKFWLICKQVERSPHTLVFHFKFRSIHHSVASLMKK